MNGLKMIRIRCNFSAKEIADILGVSIQEVEAWENAEKDIPENERIRLADFFGVEKEYLGEITREEKKALLGKAMFRQQDGSKFYYNYKPSENNKGVFFIDDRERTLDEEYLCVKKRMNTTLDDAEGIIGYYESRTSNLEDKIQNMNRRCRVYERFNQVMNELSEKKPGFSVPYFEQVESVLQALLIAHGIITEEEAQSDGSAFNDDQEFVMQLSEVIKENWKKTETVINGLTEEYKRQAEQNHRNSSNRPVTMDEKIAYARKKKQVYEEEAGSDRSDSFGIPYL